MRKLEIMETFGGLAVRETGAAATFSGGAPTRVGYGFPGIITRHEAVVLGIVVLGQKTLWMISETQ